MKKTLSFLLFFILSLSLAVPAFADIIAEPTFVESWVLPFLLILLIVIFTATMIHKRKK